VHPVELEDVLVGFSFVEGCVLPTVEVLFF